MSRYAPPVPRPVAAPARKPSAWGTRPPWEPFMRPAWGADTPKSDRNRSFAGAFGGSPASRFQRAQHEPGSVVDPVIREPVEQMTGVDLRGVLVHSGPHSRAAADSIDARAYTVGRDIHLGSDGHGIGSADRRELLAHELAHAAQQGARPVPLVGTLPVSQVDDQEERSARAIARGAVRPAGVEAALGSSPAIRLRDSLRNPTVVPSVQRDIKGTKSLPSGKFEIDFRKHDGAAAGQSATEDGSITFTPDARAPDSDEIHFIQVVRTFDTTTKAELDWTGTTEANRNKARTGAQKGVQPGFYVDQIYGSIAPRTGKSDPVVSPAYDAPPTPAGTTVGKKKGSAITPVVLTDTPGSAGSIKFNFVTAAKGSAGTLYGTVLWGFETYNDKGVSKIKNEYRDFRVPEGSTFDAAVKKFNELNRNPGASTAPK